MKLAKWSASALAAVAIALGPIATPASASGEVCVQGGCIGSAEFVSYGDHFYVHDYATDGLGVVAYLWAWNGNAWYRVTPAGGLFNRNDYNAPPVHRNYDIREYASVKYTACSVDKYGNVFNCNDWYYDNA